MNAPSNIKFRFHPSHEKSEKVLGPLEAAIMDVVWQQGDSTVSSVHKALRDKKDLAYTTVMTTMSRLAKKHLLNQDRSNNTYVYTPALDKAQFERYVVKDVLKGLIDDYGEAVFECFAECIVDLPPEEQARARAILCR